METQALIDNSLVLGVAATLNEGVSDTSGDLANLITLVHGAILSHRTCHYPARPQMGQVGRVQAGRRRM